MYEFLEEHRLKYVIGYSSNAVLKRRTELLLNYVQAHAELHGEPCCRFAQFADYQAESWSRPRRIIAKCEVTAQGGPERQITLRCVTEPDEAQAMLLHRLGLSPPRRLDEIQM